jgi:hypothetical protein
VESGCGCVCAGGPQPWTHQGRPRCHYSTHTRVRAQQKVHNIKSVTLEVGTVLGILRESSAASEEPCGAGVWVFTRPQTSSRPPSSPCSIVTMPAATLLLPKTRDGA